MSDGMPYADIVILALIAGFVLLRLRNVLGQNVGHDPLKPDSRPDPRPAFRKPEKERGIFQKPDPLTIEMREPVREEKDEELEKLPGDLRDTLTAIRAKDATFTYTSFMDGARGAFEMIFDAFNKSDRDTLKMLLSSSLYQTFGKELDRNTANAQRPETTLLSIVSQELASAQLIGSNARLTVRFVSEQVSLVRDAAGAIIEGDPSQADHVEDEWVFERDITSRNPNWTIIDT